MNFFQQNCYIKWKFSFQYWILSNHKSRTDESKYLQNIYESDETDELVEMI